MFFSFKEENLYYRQQRITSDEGESMPVQNQYSQQAYLMVEPTHDQTIAMSTEVNKHNLNDMTNYNEHLNYNQNYVQIQKQHFLPHSKMHSLDRFAVPSSLMPQPAPQRHNHHEHLTDDPDLSLNETDNEDDAYKHTIAYKPSQVPLIHVEPNTPAVGTTGYGTPYTNGGVQLEFSANESQAKKDSLLPKPVMCEETSIIDLNELDEAQLKQLQVEEEKQQQEYFNIDHLNRLYCQAQFLYKIRGKKLEEVTNRFTVYQEDMSREVRAMKHRLYLAEKEKEGAQGSLDQAHELCAQYKDETDTAKKVAAEFKEKFDKLQVANRLLEQKLAENEEEIENLQVQIGEQQKLDTLERVQEQHEHFIQQLRDQYEKDLYQMRENANELQSALKDKHEVVRMLKMQLDNAGQNAEMAAVERADTVNRLNKALNELQAKYDQEIIIAGFNNK